MANTAGTLALTYFRASAGPSPGILEFTLTYSSTTYVAAGVLNFTTIATHIPIDPNQIASITFAIESSAAAYMPVFTPNATPTMANLGTLDLYTATGTKASGSLTLVVRGRAALAGPGPLKTFF